jgi:anti-anti-sigma regulatory factor
VLKISTLVSLDHKVTLRLDGHVIGAWVELLRESAEAALEKGGQLTLDLENTRFLDCEGVVLIKSLMDRGVRQVNTPPFVAQQISNCES